MNDFSFQITDASIYSSEGKMTYKAVNFGVVRIVQRQNDGSFTRTDYRQDGSKHGKTVRGKFYQSGCSAFVKAVEEFINS